MEKRSITGKDILRMDGLLPPTRRLPVCDAVTSSEKKKEKKWSLGGILKRISAIRDYDSSSNEEEMVYCRRQPRPRTVFNRKSHNVVLHPVKSNQHLDKNSSTNSIATNLADTPSLQKDSTLSRSSDGSLDGLNKKTRKNKLKARIEAKRDRICADSSSDEETRKSFNSLPRFQNETSVQNVQKNSSSNRKSRTARTERYIKRLSRDESHRFPENLNSLTNKRSSLDFKDEKQLFDRDVDIPLQPSLQSQRPITQPNSYTFPVQRSVESLRQATASSYQTKSSNDLTKHPTNRYITDLNQNNTYAKPNISQSDRNYINHSRSNYLSNSPVTNSEYARPYNYLRNDQSTHRSSCPPEPPPRDPRCKVFTYGCNSFPFNGKYRVSRHDDTTYAKVNHMPEATRDHLEGLRSYESNNEIRWCGSTKQCPRRPLSLTVPPTQSCNLTECTNNRHNSTGRHIDETIAHETEAMKCQRRNVRNDQLNSRFTDYNVEVREKKALTTGIYNVPSKSSPLIHNRTSNSPSRKSPLKQTVPEHSNNTSNIKTEISKKKLTEMSEQDALERKRSSKNLEEALSELEAIYNSLRLGDEDLLDRAERRSMEEFCLRKGKPDDTVPLTSVDSPDRSKDDMAYRRMHPKERPTSLSEAIGQSTLSNISYLMASPVLSRKDSVFDYPYLSATNYPVHKDEPDVTRDDVVYRSIHYANNTLKVADPQPPFGIPLGPVTTATESDYLHTTPTKPDYPRSPYIPQCEPDIVTDDLAYRNLRKDANTTKNTVESKTGVTKDQETTFGVRKKRAVRSLSANLYGLIDHDRIHLRREPSLQEIKDEISESLIDIKSLPVRKDSYRRVVSDGELSDYDTRWRTESSLRSSKTDINGNHSFSNVHRQKLRVYVSPSTQVQRIDKKEDNSNAENSVTSTAILSKALDNEFWQDRLQSKSNKSSNTDTESDFTAYSRLCQDLVNLIEGPDVEPVKETTHANLEQSAKVDDLDENNKANESSVLRIQSLGSHYSKHNEKGKESTDNGDIERLTESIVDPKNEDPEKTDDNAFDFYLRVADENVKLIAEAFSSVADRLRDSRLSQKNSLTSRRSEIETDSTAPNTSTCSSVTCSPDDVNDELSTSSRTTDISHVVPKEDATIHLEEDHEKVESNEAKDNSNVDPELDLTKAVHDLQLAAASLCEHEKEIEELEALLRKDAPPSNVPIAEDEESLVSSEKESESPLLESEEKELECEQEETIVSTDVTMRTDERDPDSEGESIKCENICGPHSIGIVRSSGMRVSYVTNLITVMITTYCLVLLACFIALLLATVAAS